MFDIFASMFRNFSSKDLETLSKLSDPEMEKMRKIQLYQTPPPSPINPAELAAQAILISLTSHCNEELIDVVSAECKEIIRAAKIPEMQKRTAIDHVLNILGRLRPPNEPSQ